MQLNINKSIMIIFEIAMIITLLAGIACSNSPSISAPEIYSPVFVGSEIVGVRGFMPNADVVIYADGNEIGRGRSWIGDADFKVEPLQLNQEITATQSVGGDTSYPTREPWRATVQDPKENLKCKNNEFLCPPSIEPPLVQCQRIVTVNDLIEGARVYVSSDGNPIDSSCPACYAETPHSYADVVTPELVKDSGIAAKQNLGGKFESDSSSPAKTVEGLPSQSEFGIPRLNKKSLVYGTDRIIIDNLYKGSQVEIWDTRNNKPIGGGICCSGGGGTHLSNVQAKVDPPLEKGWKIKVKQKLCTLESESSEEDVIDSLDPPKLMEPICEGSDRITVCDFQRGAVPYVYVKYAKTPDLGWSQVGGEIEAMSSCITIPLGDDIFLEEGDEVYVKEKYGNVERDSNAVKVVKTSDPLTEVKNGHPFFKPEAGEQIISGPVFLRGVVIAGTFGPVFEAIMCGAEKVTVDIVDPLGEMIETVTLKEVKKGHFEGGWNWKHANWKIPDDIPVGEYKAKFKILGGSGIVETEHPFYVIFNPAEVKSPGEFSISEKGEKGIWFGSTRKDAKIGKDWAKTYDLHPDDERIFGQAIKLANGGTSQYEATKLIMPWVVPYRYHPHYCQCMSDCIKDCVDACKEAGETEASCKIKCWDPCHTKCLKKDPNKRFVYSICTSEEDTLDLLARKDQLAQCADSANLFVAMLRAVGIPSHPVTADAAVENGQMTWAFDTWTEARLKGPSGEDWFVFHPHEGLGPELRDSAGGNWGVASKYFDDDVIMAKEDWYPSEVADGKEDLAFKWETNCKEPNQNFDKQAAWLDHLCLPGSSGIGYWGTGHWTCSPNQSSNISISMDKERYYVGDTANIRITIYNPTEISISSRLIADISLDNPLTMQFPDEIINAFTENVTVAPRSSKEIRIRYELPTWLSSYNGYIISASFAEEYATSAFSISPLFVTDLTAPDRVEEGERFDAMLTIFNPQNVTLKSISARMDLPFEVQSPEEALNKNVDEVPPGANTTLVWHLIAASHTAVAPLEFIISSETSGGARLSRGVEIISTTSDEEVSAYARPQEVRAERV